MTILLSSVAREDMAIIGVDMIILTYRVVREDMAIIPWRPGVDMTILPFRVAREDIAVDMTILLSILGWRIFDCLLHGALQYKADVTIFPYRVLGIDMTIVHLTYRVPWKRHDHQTLYRVPGSRNDNIHADTR
jgi:hypothetical protein